MNKKVWEREAKCANSTVDFFPNEDDRRAIAAAKALCCRCPVSEHCLAFAIENRIGDGIWGNTTPKERGMPRPRNRHKGAL